jgi:hypothetical protein
LNTPVSSGPSDIRAAGALGSAAQAGPDRDDAELDPLCPFCGYILRGIESPRCPECGNDIDYAALHEPQIPWVHRKRIGGLRAYWRTVWLVMFQPRRFAAEIGRPVRLRDAQLFRLSTLVRVYLPLLAGTIVFYLFEPLQRLSHTLANWAYNNTWPVIVGHLCLILFLAAASGLPSYFFHPKHSTPEHENRAIALSYYTVAPFAFLPFCYVLGFFIYWADTLLGGVSWNWLPAAWTLGLLAGVMAVWWYVALLKLAAQTRDSDSNHWVRMAVALPALWGLTALALLVALPLVASYVAVMYASWL